MRLKSDQCPPSSTELNTCPSDVPRYSLFASWGSASSEITVPPAGPTCFHVCAGVAEAAANAIASAPNHFVFVTIISPRSAEAPTCNSLKNAPQKIACSQVQIWGGAVTGQAGLSPRSV